MVLVHKKHKWSPWGGFRGHILKPMALASKVKSLASASKPQVLQNCLFSAQEQHYFWKRQNFENRLKNFFENRFFGDRLKSDFWRSFFFLRTHAACVLGLGLEHSCPWPRQSLSSEGLSLAFASDFLFVLGLGLEPCVLDSTSDKKN